MNHEGVSETTVDRPRPYESELPVRSVECSSNHAPPRALGAAIARGLLWSSRIGMIAVVISSMAVADGSAQVDPARVRASIVERDLNLKLRKLLGVRGLFIRCPDRILMTRGSTFVCKVKAAALPETIVVTGTYINDEGLWDASIDDPRAKILVPALDEAMALWNDGDLNALVEVARPYDDTGDAGAMLEFLQCRRKTLGRYQGHGEVTGFFRVAETGTRGVLQAPLQFAAGTVSTNIFFMPDEQGGWHAGGWELPAAPPDWPLPTGAALQSTVEREIEALYTGRFDELSATVVDSYSEEQLGKLGSTLQEQGALLRVGNGAIRRSGDEGWVLFETLIESESGRQLALFELFPCGDEWLLSNLELKTAPPAVVEDVADDAQTFSVTWLEKAMVKNLRRTFYGPSLDSVRCPDASGELRQGVRYRCIAEIPTGGENDFYVVVTDGLEHFTLSDP